HRELEEQVRRGIATIFINKMLFGVNFQEVLQNAVLLNLPSWFVDGLVDYIGKPWSVELDNRLAEGILNGKFKKIKKLEAKDARFMGHAFWHYLEMTYGESAVPNLLYLTRINRSLESGFLFVLGSSVNEALREWYEFNLARYAEERDSKDILRKKYTLESRINKKKVYYQLKLNPDGNKIAYVSNEMGLFKVYVENVKTNKRNRIVKGGFRTNTILNDQSYPLLSWSPSGKKLAIVYERRDKLFLMTYDWRSKEKVTAPINKFQRVFSMSYAEDDNNLLFSGLQKGQIDIFKYFIPSTKVTKITDDFYDDLDPSYVEIDGMKGVAFSSNRDGDTLKTARLDTSMPVGSFDIFFYNEDENTEALIRLTNTPGIDESMPEDIGVSNYAYLSEQNGVINRYYGSLKQVLDHYRKVYYYENIATGKKDSISLREQAVIDSFLDLEYYEVSGSRRKAVSKFIGVNSAVTNSARNILEHDIAIESNKAANLYWIDGKYAFYVSPIDTNLNNVMLPILENTSYMESRSTTIRKKKEPSRSSGNQSDKDPEKQTTEISEQKKADYFQTDFDYPEEEDNAGDVFPDLNPDAFQDKSASGNTFKQTKVRPYTVKFATDEIVSQFDNSIIMTRYQKFNPQDPGFTDPDFSAFFKLGIRDLMEDYRIYGGFRIPLDFNSSEYFFTYENIKKRIDKRFTYYRKSMTEGTQGPVPFLDLDLPSNVNFIEYKIRTNYVEAKFSYPIDILRSVRLGIAIRNDKYIFQSLSQFSLDLENYKENWAFLRAEYVFDNTIDIATNIRYGTRYKFFSEIHKQIPTRDVKLIDGIVLPVPRIEDSYLAVWGVDFRHYQKIHRQIIWASKFGYSTSIGTRKLIYYLGGVEGWVSNNTFDNETPINGDNNYAFQTIATNMRGFRQNARNGNSYMLVNTEIRFPVFSYFLNSPIRSEFIKHFQLVPFADVGTAWEGATPFSRNNPQFTRTFGDDPVQVKINYFKNPIIMGYGLGARTVLLGYFLRLDASWGWDSGEIKGPLWYFSLNLDF
ncbi:MAG: hypothetical protein HKN92_11945, partial [Chitinophagales bacterium]|nr:hypothetical protein [Chitinophagales bacterium]